MTPKFLDFYPSLSAELAWGNTVVLRPAEDTPASAMQLARLALEAGLVVGGQQAAALASSSPVEADRVSVPRGLPLAG